MSDDTNNQRFFGKYRGTVTDNRDPQQLGRIQANVPDVLGGNASGWALPCVPYAGNQVGLFALPPVGTSVWMEFEQGNPDYPVWSGCFWASGEPPATPAQPEQKVFKTDGITLTIDDTPGVASLKLETTGGQKIEVTANGIKIDNGTGATVELTGPSVKLNGQALEVT